jgi:hypothetical protein
MEKSPLLLWTATSRYTHAFNQKRIQKLINHKAAINPKIPTTPIAAPETAVGTAPPAEDEDVPTTAVLATLATLEAPLEPLLAALETLLTAVLKIEVTPEMTSVVNEETTLPAALVPVPDEVVVVVATTPLVDVSVTDAVLVGPVLDSGNVEVIVLPAESVVVMTVLAGNSVVVMVLPAELVVVMTDPTTIGPPGDFEEVARKALIPVSSAATWVDQGVTAEENHPGMLIASRAS